jgi:predicted DNA-binding transcriptional regulator AlpA
MPQTAFVPPDLAALANLPDDALINVGQVAKLYCCSIRHAWRAADQGLIPHPLRVGRIVRWRLGTIRDHIRSGCRPVRRG